MFDRHRLQLFTLVLLSSPLGACADDVGMTSTSESSTGTSTGDQSTTNNPSTPTPTTVVPTTTESDPTTGSTTDPTTVTDTSSSTEPVTVTDTSTGTTGTEGTTDTSTSTTGTDTSGTEGSSSTTESEACPKGQINCDCDNGFCNGMAACILDKCLPAGDGSCPYEYDGECDEGLFCDFGSDPFDCCATPQDGNCEEFDFGGQCAPYSDYFDCGYCPFEDNLVCNSPQVCPPETDVNDCCPTPQDGVCEEMQAGGVCNDGTDPYDCGVCVFENDNFCDVPLDCPEGTDQADCCATEEDGVCEEMQFGGTCPDGSDPYDCGICEFEDDGFCDVPGLCPQGSDLVDCCATKEDGVCEEMQFGGQCNDGSDFYDCGYCIYEDDFECDVPFFCPEGSDVNDCA